MNTLENDLPGADFQFGVISLMDYPLFPHDSDDNCGHNPGIGWRNGARRILLNFGDNVPHDCNLNEGIPGKSDTWSTGKDPGRDELFNTDDDLDLHDVLRGLVENNTMMIHAYSTADYQEYWQAWTSKKGGAFFLTSATSLVEDVVNVVEDSNTLKEINDLHVGTAAIQKNCGLTPAQSMEHFQATKCVFDDHEVAYGLNVRAEITINCTVPPTPCDSATVRPSVIWPANHNMVQVGIEMAEPVAIAILAIEQNEPLDVDGDCKTSPDAQILPCGLALVRAEWSGLATAGRTYRIKFEASSSTDKCEGTITICVPHDRSIPCEDNDRAFIDSTTVLNRNLRSNNKKGGNV
ncbi:hypothetical protein IV203_007763 [Nitzschia inconspicua]|uniref:Uncharacterized protein n=1 Tax=Nitzschia inconspicua TaxID=303405 RepID=A0A9K3PLB8_9STRA|nr:hypothetical protein IV203_007763 [Nitzschia inconspicua]